MSVLPVLGWREWVALPDLGIEHIKCKVDTGARTSALHAFFIDPDSERGLVRFGIHPLQRRTDVEKVCVAAVRDQRQVRDSGGHREKRYIIETKVAIDRAVWLIEVSLTDRDTMLFRMLLGRTALHQRYLVDPAKSYLIGKRHRYADVQSSRS